MLFEDISLSLTLKTDQNPTRDNAKHYLRKIFGQDSNISGVVPNTPKSSFLLEDKHPHASFSTLPTLPDDEILYRLMLRSFTMVLNLFTEFFLVDEMG